MEFAIFFWVPLILFGLFVLGLILTGIYIVLIALEKIFWSIMGYDTEVRHEIDTSKYDDPSFIQGNP